MPRLGFRLWIRKIIQKFKPKLFLKSLWQFIIVIGLPILGVWLANTANNIAKSSYNLSKNDTSQQSQINQLQKIIENQKTQIDTLIVVSKRLQEQNKLTQTQNQLTQEQSIELVSQGKKINKQLEISQYQQIENAENSFLQRKGNFNKLEKTVSDIIECSFISGKDTITKYNQSEQILFLTNTSFLLQKELDNPYLLESKEAFSAWRIFYQDINSLSLFLIHKFPVTIFDKNKEHLANEKEREKFFIDEWEKLCNKYSKFLGHLIIPIMHGNQEFNAK